MEQLHCCRKEWFIFYPKGIIYKSISSGEAEVNKYPSSGTTVTIPSKVNGKTITKIGDNAFKNKRITNITISPSVTSIGAGAFAGNTSLQEIKLPSSIRSIGDQAFSGNTNLREIKLPISIRSIGDQAFSGCYKLTNVILEGSTPPSVKSNSFPKTTWFTVGNAFNTYIETGPWNRNHFIRDTKETIHLAYDGKIIYSINESDQTASIVRGYNETNISLKDKVFDNHYFLVGIEKNAFKGCSELKEITIPGTIVSIGANAFSGCKNLISVYLSKESAPTCDMPIFDKKNKTIVYVPKSSVRLYKKQKGWNSSNKIIGQESPDQQNSYAKANSISHKTASTSIPSFNKTKTDFSGFAKHFAGLRIGFGGDKMTEGIRVLSLGAYYDFVPKRWGAHIGFDYGFDLLSGSTYGVGIFAGPEIRLTKPSSSPVDLKLYVAPGYAGRSFGFDVGMNLGWRSQHKLSFYDISLGYQNWGFNTSMGYVGLGSYISAGSLLIALSVGLYIILL